LPTCLKKSSATAGLYSRLAVMGAGAELMSPAYFLNGAPSCSQCSRA
jgi:hypothetical protein